MWFFLFVSLINISSLKLKKDMILSILCKNNDFPTIFNAKFILANDFIFE